MKKTVKYLGVYIVSLLVFYGGSGINVASFCCDDCKSGGIAGIVEGACCAIHCHKYEDANHHQADANSDCDTYDTHCSLSRLLNDWDTSNTSTFKFEPNYFTFTEICLPLDLTASPQIEPEIAYQCSTGPPVCCPRTYLTLLTTLLI